MMKKLLKMYKDKKGVFENFEQPVISLAVLGLILVVIFLIYANLASNATVAADQNATAAVTSTQGALDDFPTWFAIIVVVIVGVLLIALVKRIRT